MIRVLHLWNVDLDIFQLLFHFLKCDMIYGCNLQYIV